MALTLYRETDERIRASIDGTPDGLWDGLSNADIWWVLTSDEDGGSVVEDYSDSDPEITVEQAGGGADEAVITVELDATTTAALSDHQYWQEVVVRDADGNVTVAKLNPHKVVVEESSAGEVTP